MEIVGFEAPFEIVSFGTSSQTQIPVEILIIPDLSDQALILMQSLTHAVPNFCFDETPNLLDIEMEIGGIVAIQKALRYRLFIS